MNANKAFHEFTEELRQQTQKISVVLILHPPSPPLSFPTPTPYFNVPIHFPYFPFPGITIYDDNDFFLSDCSISLLILCLKVLSVLRRLKYYSGQNQQPCSSPQFHTPTASLVRRTATPITQHHHHPHQSSSFHPSSYQASFPARSVVGIFWAPRAK